MPATIQDYEHAPHDWASIVGVAQPGTLIRVTKIELYNHPENGREVFIRGRLLADSWAKKTAELFMISGLSSHGDYSNLPVLDTNVLELVTRP